MTQIAIRLEDRTLAELDRLVADGEFENRSDVVRRAIDDLVESARQRRIAAEIVQSYSERPVGEDETFGHELSTSTWDQLDDDDFADWRHV